MGRARTVVFASALVLSTLAAPARAGLQDDVDQAVAIVERFRDLPEKSIPDAVLHQARGLAILTVVKAGFGFSAQGGKGLVIARTDSGWSGPSAIGTGGAGFGLQIGVEVSELVIVLNTPDAVHAFARGGNVSIGADLSGAARSRGSLPARSPSGSRRLRRPHSRSLWNRAGCMPSPTGAARQ